MGIKGLWTLLAPYCEQKPLHEVKGEVLAVDLSGWVCDSQSVSDPFTQPKMYLRNLFFRTSYLLLSEITPVFVLEGEAPTLKKDTMANRNAVQSKLYRRINKPSKPKGSDTKRKRFGTILGHCENLLNSMGVQCVKGKGEAEAMCAHLNSIGLVNAVISQDSDCFAYGAKRVYRNFSVSTSGGNSANSGSVDVYDMLKICNAINLIDFGRNKVIVMALLCGSDYNESGVEGVGYSSAVTFLMQHEDSIILERLKSWKTEPYIFHKLASEVNNSNNCLDCGHPGNAKNHQRLGCRICGTSNNCDKSYKEKRQILKNELAIRTKAIACSNFPDTEIIEEFLEQDHEVPSDLSVDWKRPDLIKFIKIMTKSLAWTESYCIEKFLPLITKWQLVSITQNKATPSSKKFIYPDRIKKKRTVKGLSCYEVVWADPNGLYEKIITDEQINSPEDLEKIWTTIERQDLMEEAYPNVVDAFLGTLKKSTKRMKKNKQQNNKMTNYLKTNDDIERLNETLQNMSITKRKRKNLEASFNTSIKRKKQRRKLNKSGLLQKRLSTFVKKKDISIDDTVVLKNLTLNDDFSEGELSCIIQDIITKNIAKPKQYYISTPNKSNTPEKFNVNKKRVSHFFDRLADEVDEFERSLDLRGKISDSGDEHEEIFPADVSIIKTDTPVSSKPGSPVYTPLCERIKKYKLLKRDV